MKINIEDMNLAVVGTFEHQTQRELVEKLEARGAVTTKNLNQHTTALLYGQRREEVINAARIRGISVLDEAQAEKLLRDGFFEIDEIEIAGGSELFGELRGLLHDTTPIDKTWLAVCALLDRSEPEEASVLAHYAGDVFDSWETKGVFRDYRADPTPALNRDNLMWSSSAHKGFKGEICVAPVSWLTELNQGSTNGKFAVLRGLDFSYSELSSTSVKKILSNPHLYRLRSLALPVTKPVTEALVKQLCSSPLRERIVTLRLGYNVSARTREWFIKHGRARSALRMLDLVFASGEMACPLHGVPYFQDLDTVMMNCQDIRRHDFSTWETFFRELFEGKLLLLDIGQSLPDESFYYCAEDPVFLGKIKALEDMLCQSPLLESVFKLKLGRLYPFLNIKRLRASHSGLIVKQ